MRNSTTKVKLNRKNILGAGLFWILVWQVLAWLVDNTLLLPSPLQTVAALAALAVTPEFYMNIGWTVARCLIAMVLSFGAGVLAAWWAYKMQAVRNLLALPVGFFKAVPVMAIIIYVILLAKADWVAIIVCFFMCFPVVYINVLEGLDGTSRDLLEVGKIYNMTAAQKRRLIYWPSALPQIKAAIKLIAGLSWKAVVAAEVLSVPQFSLGYEMMNAKYYLETENLFAYILVIIVLSLALERIINLWVAALDSKNYEGSKLKTLTKSQIDVGKAPAIAAQNLTKGFGDKKVLENLSMTFDDDNVTVLMAPSGHGKTTLMRILAGLETADSGEVKMDKTAKISMLFQEDRLFPWLNVYDNMNLAGSSDDEVRKMAAALELEDVLWKLPEELSGGMRHRVALARTFLAGANVMILDEPFRGLNEELKRRIVDKLWERVTADKTVLVVTHSIDDAKLLGGMMVSL